MVELLAPAKINLTLEILTRRADGYHTLRSVMVPIGLYDTIRLEASERTSLAIAAGDPALARDNLVMRALEACAPSLSYDVTLEKRIPIGGGLGGGSSDAAAIVEAAMDGRLPTDGTRDWLAIASRLGSDVPFFLAGTAALVEGTGERVTPAGAVPPWWCVVVRPHVAVATAAAYGALDDARAAAPTPPRPRSESASLRAIDALQRADLAALEASLENDFHDLVIARHAEVARAYEALRAAGAARPMLSGSGSCLFALFEGRAGAEACAAQIDAAACDLRAAVPLHRSERWRGR